MNQYARSLLSVCLTAALTVSAVSAADRPNILWLSCEDISPHLGCYGYPNATTPNVDAFAQQATLFEHAYTTAGVCAPCRSAIITGMYQTSIGSQHMRCEAILPDHVKPFTFAMKEAGYYCTNNSKQDYQFKTPKGTWDESSGKAHWNKRPDNSQPFFSVFNFVGCHESRIADTDRYKSAIKGLTPHDRGKVAASLPPYYPDTPVTREDWGRYYDVITAMDRWVGEHLKALDEAGVADDTIVVYWSDHGVGLPRAKRWLYESGTHVPLIIRVPERWQSLVGEGFQPGTRSDRMISMIDLGPSMLSLAGVPAPEHMQGKAFMGPHSQAARKYIFGARDRMDERYDIIRMVRDKQFRYIRNYEPYKTWFQYMNTAETGRTMQEIRRVAAEAAAAEDDDNSKEEKEEATANKKMAPAVAQFLQPRKPLEELYDVDADPHELNNLAADPAFAEKLEELRAQHLNWVLETRDLGLIPEAELHRLRDEAGSEWAILNEGEAEAAETRMQTIRDAAFLAGGTAAEDLTQLATWLRHEDAIVRYWAATGIGNRGDLRETFFIPTSLFIALLSDESENVRVAAARVLAEIGQDELALNSLSKMLDEGTQWARLHAAIVLDEMGEKARPAIDAMKRNKDYRDGLVAKGKYVVRVLNKALNDLEGTQSTVP
ncbi:sulfatase-like hydrolase/transferase [Fuerstiella marisgermanici]|uniref:Arylsulfatase n=1 Tax=Fuerstiella marisgermanici TaxID=1891926 RepID=A0A1P8WEI2_9PLAN|nr:sulfatase-like hydrolase/transferase [Fuerstiella marisgermanici]APZ92452.1 Arylsulfatase [Fuerstiella marisgermanici]